MPATFAMTRLASTFGTMWHVNLQLRLIFPGGMQNLAMASQNSTQRHSQGAHNTMAPANLLDPLAVD
jgi:hypothetical protein